MAALLRAGLSVPPERYGEVSILFLDIVEFTTLSGALRGEKVVAMLTRFFSALDAVAAELELYKVETIGAQSVPARAHPPLTQPRCGPADGCSRHSPAGSGDCYICAASIPEWQPDHALRIAQFALRAVAAANATPVDLDDVSSGFINIRVGLHSGPVVASLVGRKYTLIG